MATNHLTGIRKYHPKPVKMQGLHSASTLGEDSISYRVVTIFNKKKN